MVTTSDISSLLYSYLMKLPPEQLVEVSIDALDMMQQYNGRSKTFCIISSIDGATVKELEDGSYTYTLPSIK